MSFQLIAVANIADTAGDSTPTILFSSGMIGLLLGLTLSTVLIERPKQHIQFKLINQRHHNRKIFIVLCLVLLGVTYHYAVGGIPLLSSSITTARFDNDSSGLFGLPGRINLFGTFFIFYLASISYLTTNNKTTKILAILAGVTLLTSLVLAGSKGNILQFAAAVVFLSPYINYSAHFDSRIVTRHKGFSKIYYIAAAILSLFFFVIVSNLFIQSGDSTYGDALDALVRRVTEVSGQAFFITATRILPSEGIGFGHYIIGDIAAFLSNFGITQSNYYSTTQIASSYVTGRSLDSGLFLVPVTITSNGYFLLEFGYIGPFLMSVLIGVAMRSLYYLPMKSTNITKRAYALYAQSFIFWFITKGSIGYYSINMLIMAAFLLAIITITSNTLRIGRPDRESA